jgi:dethiobiotin synthetase
MKVIVAGIGTEVGKTIVSAVFCEAFELDYWKPIQSGANEDNDSHSISNLVTKEIGIFPNTYCFQEPLSPDQAAKLEGVVVDPSKLILPTSEKLLIEPAGGLMVPLTAEGFLFSDQLKIWNIPIILVSRFYLGSINHTLLSLELLKSKGLHLAGIVFTGDVNAESEAIIRHFAPTTHFFHIPWTENLSPEFIQEQARNLRESSFQQLFL